MEEPIENKTAEILTENKKENTVTKPTPKLTNPKVSRARTTANPSIEKTAPATRTKSAAKVVEPVVEMPKAIEVTEVEITKESFAPIEKTKKNKKKEKEKAKNKAKKAKEKTKEKEKKSKKEKLKAKEKKAKAKLKTQKAKKNKKNKGKKK